MFMLLVKLFIFLSATGSVINQKFKVWGPGLRPHIIVMPARYFFIQPANSNISCLDTELFVKIEGLSKDKRSCRIWTNVLKRLDCFYIIRYKVYETCENLIINIKHNNEDIAESPYVINKKIYTETCNCPTKDLITFLNDWECGATPLQITKDLASFNNINFNDLRTKIISKYNNPGGISLCHYIIKDNKIYRKCYGKYVGFKMFIDNILISLSKKVVLPDLEFFVNLGDWPLVRDLNDNFPIFSWCGSRDTFDIVMPTYDITESTLENMGRVMLDMLSVQANVKYEWKNKIPKVFWRGRDSNRHRLNLIDISRKYPNLFNASLTNFFFFRDEQEKYGPKSEHVSFFSFFDYKFQLSIDGTVAAYRIPYLLSGGSLLLKQESKFYEHFYNDLIPNVHYISVKEDLSDLLEKINWALQNDEKAKSIAIAGQDFATHELFPKNIYCYHAFLLHNFKKKLSSKVHIFEDMEITEKSSDDCDCDKIKIKEEL